jgi:tRNA uridine 5-carboxymethylaminomethyl modification enzyme
MVDDLVTKGADEPYRMFTSRAEMRLSLRYDNADQRLTPLGHKVGSIHEAEYRAFVDRQRGVERVKEFLMNTRVTDLDDEVLSGCSLEGSSEALQGKRLDYLARRPDFDAGRLLGVVHARLNGQVRDEEIEVALRDTRYAGYLKDQEALARKRGRYDELVIPVEMDFARISGLSNEAVQKLTRVRPRTIGQAARIPGITPAAVSILLVEALRA